MPAMPTRTPPPGGHSFLYTSISVLGCEGNDNGKKMPDHSRIVCECLARVGPTTYKPNPDCIDCGGTGYRARRPHGFAALTPERRRELAAKGGRAAQASGKGHRFTVEEARLAGSKGGRKTAFRKALASMPEET